MFFPLPLPFTIIFIPSNSIRSLICKPSHPAQNNIVASLVKATSPPAPADDKPSAAPNSNPPFRFFVNSVLIQQGLADPDDARIEHAGVRGMHAASGAYWDVSRDGTWSFKYPGAAEKGLDAVLTISWFATV